MGNYTKATNFSAKDSLAAGNPNKIVKGSEIDAELSAIATAIASKADATSVTVPASFKNKIRNPKMEITVRSGLSVTGLSTTAGTYTLDGWQYVGVGVGSVVTVSQQSDVASNSECQFSIRTTVTTADNTVTSGKLAVIRQPIEGCLVRDFLGNPIAVRFEVKSPKSGIHCVAIQNGAQDRSYVAEYTITSANTWQTITLPLAATGLPSGGTWNFTTGTGLYLVFPLMAGSTYQTTPGAWQTGNFVATSNQQNLLDTLSNVFAFTGVQLEKSTASTTLEHRDIGLEGLINYRYAQPIPGTMWGQQFSSTGFAVASQLVVPMRAAGTVVNGGFATVQIVGVGNATGVGGFGAATLTASYIRLNGSNTAGGTGSNPIEATTGGLITSELS